MRCAGELDLAQAVWSKMAAGKSGTSRVYQAIDSLLTNHKAEPVLEITETHAPRRPARLGSTLSLRRRAGVARKARRGEPSGSKPCLP